MSIVSMYPFLVRPLFSILTFIPIINITVSQADALPTWLEMKPISRALSPRLWHSTTYMLISFKKLLHIVSFLRFTVNLHGALEPKAQLISTKTAWETQVRLIHCIRYKNFNWSVWKMRNNQCNARKNGVKYTVFSFPVIY